MAPLYPNKPETLLPQPNRSTAYKHANSLRISEIWFLFEGKIIWMTDRLKQGWGLRGTKERNGVSWAWNRVGDKHRIDKALKAVFQHVRGRRVVESLHVSNNLVGKAQKKGAKEPKDSSEYLFLRIIFWTRYFPRNCLNNWPFVYLRDMTKGDII